MINTIVYDNFSSLKPAWETLVKRLPVFYPFLTWEWQNTWWEVGKGSGLLNILVSKKNDPLGIGSFRLEKGNIYWSANEEVSDYLDIICIAKDYENVWHTILEKFKELGIKKAVFRNLPEASPTIKTLVYLSSEMGIKINKENEDVVPFIGLPKSYEDYLQMLSRKDRHEIRRKWRRFEKETAGDWKITKSGPGSLENDCGKFFDLFRKDGDAKRQFLTPEMEKFFCRETQAMEKLGLLDFSSLLISGRVVAQTIAFKTKDRYFLFNMAVEPDFLHLSPGLMLNKLLIEECINEKLKIYDFMQGNERYKYQLGAKDEYVYKITINL